MRGLNRFLAGLAVAVLIVTLALLGWMSRRARQDLEESIKNAAELFDPKQLLHGPLGTRLLHFGLTELAAARAVQNPYINQVIISKLNSSGEENPVHPYKLFAEDRENWKKRVEQWERKPLGNAEQPFGYIYLDLDRSGLHSIYWAIGTLGLATALMLFTLLARLWSQETSLTRTTIELNERRRELIRVERLALAGQLAAGLLHDLRKPVLHIKNSVDDLAETLGDFAPATVSLQDMGRQTRLFFQMLTESQIERFVQSDRVSDEYVDLVQAIDLSLNLVRYERRGVEVIRREPSGLPPVLAQPFRLIQLFSNIILNAYQATGGKGQLIIDGRQEQRGVEIRFTDSGQGIAPELIDHIFDPFYTTKPEGMGTGLGLSICRMIVDDLGGRISAESRMGGPTIFYVWLPATGESNGNEAAK